MATTSENLTILKRNLSKFSKEELLGALNDAVQLVYEQGSEATWAYDASTGNPPFLVTYDNVFEYDAPSDCSQVVSVFSEYQTYRGYGKGVSYDFDTYRWNDREWAKAPVDVRPKTPDDLAKIIFRANPGDTTDRYYLLYAMEHPAIDSVNVEMKIAARAHLYVRELVKVMLSAESYGNPDDYIRRVEGLIKEIRNKMNNGSTIRHVGRTNPQFYDRSFEDCRMPRGYR